MTNDLSSNNDGLPSSFDYIIGNGVQFVDSHDTSDLKAETIKSAHVAAGGTSQLRYCFRALKPFGAEPDAKLFERIRLNECGHIRDSQRLKLMAKANPISELGKARDNLFETVQSHEYNSNTNLVEQISNVLKGLVFKPVCLIYDD